MKKLYTIILSLLLVSVFSAADLDAPDELDFGELFSNETGKKDFIITNDKGIDLTNLLFIADVDGNYIIEFDPETWDSLEENETLDVDIKITVPFDVIDKEDVTIGKIILKTDKDDFDLSDLILSPRSLLYVEKIRVEIDNEVQTATETDTRIDEPVNPLETVSFEIEVENLFNTEADQEIEINDVSVRITINGIGNDGDEVELESETIDLDYEGNGRTHTFQLELDVPVGAEEDLYEVEIEITGEDDDDNDYEIIWILILEVERETYNLIVPEFSVDPDSVKCDANIILDFEIVNIGKTDENYVHYTLKSSSLGIDEELTRFEISADPDDDENVYRASVPASVPIIEPGTYPIELAVYRDFDLLEELLTIDLEVTSCSKTNPVPPPVEEKKEIDQPVQTEQPEEQGSDIPAVQISDSPAIVGTALVERSSASLMVLIISLIILIGLSLIVLLIVLRKKH
ncbi:hypothetical protein GOV09_06820 [Candidatus Woesearchaeota archaeon]|nr:hypothetical protein [Candidatus Woesearchaeota archaeon]